MKLIEQVLADTFPGRDFSGSDDFYGDGLLDSLDILRLVGSLDHAFEISIPGQEIHPGNFLNLETIQAMVDRNKTQ